MNRRFRYSLRLLIILLRNENQRSAFGKSQYVRKRIVLTLPVSNRQGIFLPILEQKTLKKDKKSVKIRTISSVN